MLQLGLSDWPTRPPGDGHPLSDVKSKSGGIHRVGGAHPLVGGPPVDPAAVVGGGGKCGWGKAHPRMGGCIMFKKWSSRIGSETHSRYMHTFGNQIFV